MKSCHCLISAVIISIYRESGNDSKNNSTFLCSRFVRKKMYFLTEVFADIHK